VQEGIIVPPIRIANARGWNEEVLALVLANVRTPQERRGDLAAQRAACAAGARGWQALRVREGATTLDAAVRALLDYTERRARARLEALEGATGAAEDALEGDGVSDEPVRIAVAARIANGTLHLDVSGSAPQVRGNVNCPLAVTRAAAVFVLRTLLDEDVPTNDGIARAIDIIAPEGSVVNARWPAAVAAGNVETSQRITDTIFAALADAGIPVPGQGQGTMNNVTFGGAGWTFYETIGGGQGASAHAPGPSAVHVGMSNTRNTPIEALETAYPIRIEEYAVRRGSGGAGAQRGGDGVIRRYRVLERCTLTLLTERRKQAPRGVAGGGDGERGRNVLDGRDLPAKCRVELEPGQVVTIETPGGGAYGGR
jgi:N-methylhydantoinase B